eukprot:Filipodium_phascolosomae@DN61_c0_g1_i1.p1
MDTAPAGGRGRLPPDYVSPLDRPRPDFLLWWDSGKRPAGGSSGGGGGSSGGGYRNDIRRSSGGCIGGAADVCPSMGQGGGAGHSFGSTSTDSDAGGGGSTSRSSLMVPSGGRSGGRRRGSSVVHWADDIATTIEETEERAIQQPWVQQAWGQQAWGQQADVNGGSDSAAESAVGLGRAHSIRRGGTCRQQPRLSACSALVTDDWCSNESSARVRDKVARALHQGPTSPTGALSHYQLPKGTSSLLQKQTLPAASLRANGSQQNTAATTATTPSGGEIHGAYPSRHYLRDSYTPLTQQHLDQMDFCHSAALVHYQEDVHWHRWDRSRKKMPGFSHPMTAVTSD